MKRKLKLFVAALLGFSTACSSVKQAPKQKDRQKDGDSVIVVGDPDAGESQPRIIVMYGVFSPQSDSLRRQRMERMMPDSLPPVVEEPREEDPHPDGK